jgi:ubiquinol-cytochrome c reductase cytochrome b subunit
MIKHKTTNHTNNKNSPKSFTATIFNDFFKYSLVTVPAVQRFYNQSSTPFTSKNRVEKTHGELTHIVQSHLANYPTPANISYAWNFGSLAGFALFIQFISGIFLAMHYCSDADQAFASVEHIMRDVNGGWFIRYLHANGASAFFAVIYLHIFKGLFYKSYKFTNFKVWLSGIAIFITIMATAFIGYVLPWGQISFWGATVITSFFSVVPLIGTELVQWLWGGFAVGAPTLSRFFSIHYVLPFVIAALVGIHLYFLHGEGSSNPFPGEHRDINFFYLPLYPYFMVKDLVGVLVFSGILMFFVCFEPNMLGHSDNYIEANSIVTPEHIVPEWYFLPFYAILRSIPNKTLGIIAMGAAIIALALISLDSFFTQKEKLFNNEISTSVETPFTFQKATIHNFIVILFGCTLIILGFIGSRPVEEPYLTVGFWFTCLYFFILELFFLSNLSIRFFFKKKSYWK